VTDLARSRLFYDAVLGVLGIPVEGEGDGYFWADEFVVSSADSAAAQGKLTGPTHVAFQAKDRATVDAFYKAGLLQAAAITERRANVRITPGTTRRSCSIRTATTSRRCTTVQRSAPPTAFRSGSKHKIERGRQCGCSPSSASSSSR
jgi:hypothetical protein